MAFGGAVKLTGESEYRKAISNITQSLKEVTAQMKLTSASYDSNDKSVSALTAKSQVLNKQMDLEKQKVQALKAQYAAMSEQYDVNADKNSELIKTYNQEKAKLDELGKSIDTTSKEYKEQEKQHKQLTQSYNQEKAKLDELGKTLGKSSTEYKEQKSVVNSLEKELKATTTEYQAQKDKVAQLEKDVKKSTAAQDANAKSMSKMRVEIANAETEYKKTERALENLGKAAKDSGNDAEKAGDGFTTFKGIVANLASTAITQAVSGLKKLGGALIDVGKQAISSYAQYEQLTGGVETLFGESADVVKEYAANAYKTAGMSANQYMENVTSFSATLLQGLNGDTAKAAKIADLAIRDMSDNANKMGTDMTMIQNAYQGFAKDNYTMLDNLKLGYGGTQAEMARLINESGVMNGEFKATAQNVKDIPFDKMIEAIHKVQENMGITGTTALEASETIEGSAGSMKAAWSNLLTAIADDNADLSKSVDEFVSSAVTSAKNLVPRIKNVVDNIKKLATSIVTEAFPKIKREIPQLKPLIETFEWFIKHRGTVVTAIKAMVAAFVVAKIASWTKSLSDAAKGVIDFVKSTVISTAATKADTAAEVTNTGAKVAGTTATGALTVAQRLLNAAMAANPIGMVVAALSALVGVIALVVSSTNQLTEEEQAQIEKREELTDKINQEADAWDSLKESQQKQIDAGMTEISHIQDLWDELQTLVDQNGKVKEGYEERASFITSTLSNALGTEITTTDGVIDKYGELKSSIVDVMEQKKAQLILDAQESGYKTALENQATAARDLSEAEGVLTKSKSDLSALEQKLADEKTARDNAMDVMSKQYHDQRMSQIQSEIYKKQEQVDQDQKNYDKQLDLFGQYAYEIGQYEDNLALFHAGKYDEMSTVTWDYVKDFKGAGEAEKEALEQKIKDTETKLSELEQLRDKSNSKIYDGQISAARKELTQLQDQMKQYTSATDQGLNETEIVWSNSLADQLSQITGKKVEFKDAGNGQVQAYIDGEKVGAPKAKKEMAQIATDSIKEITNKKPEAKSAGEDLIDGINNGVSNESKQSSVFSAIASFGSRLLSRLRTSLQEKSPSKATKEMGEYLLDGLQIGIGKKQSETIKQVSGIGANIIDALNSELSQGAKIGAIDVSTPQLSGAFRSTAQLSESMRWTAQQANYERENGFDRMVDAFKTALGQMKIELDDEVAGKFVEQTVTRIVYN